MRGDRVPNLLKGQVLLSWEHEEPPLPVIALFERLVGMTVRLEGDIDVYVSAVKDWELIATILDDDGNPAGPPTSWPIDTIRVMVIRCPELDDADDE